MGVEDLQTTDISAGEVVAETSEPQAPAAGEPVVDDNAYLQELIAADDEDLGEGEPPVGDDTGGSGQTTGDEADAGSPSQTDGNETPAEAQTTPETPATPDASQAEQQTPASEAAPESTPQAQQPPQAPTQEGTSQTVEEFNQQFNAFFEQRVGELAQNVYALDDATKEALDTEPSKVIPQLAGRLHMQVLTTALNQVAQMLPTVMSEFSSQNQANQQAEDSFYDKWGSLKEHKSAVEAVAQVYMQANKGVDMEKAINDIGTMVSVQLGIPLPTPGNPQPAPQSQTPQAQPVALTPLAPASSGGAGASTTNTGQPEAKSWLEDLVRYEE